MKILTKRTVFLDKKGFKKSNEFEIKTIGDLNVLFNNAIVDASLYARLRNGTLEVTREKDSLYISYLDVPNSNLIDCLYKLTEK
jgi:hypothetical protein